MQLWRYFSQLAAATACLLSACGSDAAAPNAGPVDGSATYRLTVNNGHGSGTYSVGQTVYVWSAVNPFAQVHTRWAGDSTLLKEPLEWTSSFTMPDRNVTLSAVIQDAPIALKSFTYLGSTSLPKKVNYYFPPNMQAVMLMSHGTGGSSAMINELEARQVALVAAVQGIGVISTEAEEVVAGDLNGDGYIRWNTRDQLGNVDLKNLEVLFYELEQKGLLSQAVPKFAMGMSNGGSFSIFLGSVAASAPAGAFPRLRFNAVASYCSGANPAWVRATLTPTAWYMCRNDENAQVSNSQARQMFQLLKTRNVVSTDYLEHPPTPLYMQRFLRVMSGVTQQTTNALAGELFSNGIVDARGRFLNNSTRCYSEFQAKVQANPAAFPAFTTLPKATQMGVGGQIQVMCANHHMYADYAQRMLDFFARSLK